MYLLIACGGSWLALLLAFIRMFALLPQPWTWSDYVIIVMAAAVMLAFSRIGVVSILAVLLRLLPHGMVRVLISEIVLRCVPTILRSSVVAVLSTGLMFQTAHAAPSRGSVHEDEPESNGLVAPDPGWPITDDSITDHGADGLDPSWPLAPPNQAGPGPDSDIPAPMQEPPGPPDPSDSVPSEPSPEPNQQPSPPPSRSETIHIVSAGDSLWSIAAQSSGPDVDIADRVAEIHAGNRAVIGPNPHLITPGQRLEIQP